MRNAWTIAKRELAGYFTSPVAYVFMVIFLVLAGFFTFMLGGFFPRGEASLTSFFVWHPWLYMLLVPAVGMRLWAEEQRMGTMELLCTMPITPCQAIVGKYAAGWLVLALALLLTLPMYCTVHYLGSPDDGPILAGYLGSLLLSGSYLAVSNVTSAFTRNQIVSFITSVVVCLLLVLSGYPPVTNILLKWGAPGAVIDFFAGLSVMTHYENLQRGVIDLRDLLYFVSLMVFSIFTTGVVLSGRRR